VAKSGRLISSCVALFLAALASFFSIAPSTVSHLSLPVYLDFHIDIVRTLHHCSSPPDSLHIHAKADAHARCSCHELIPRVLPAALLHSYLNDVSLSSSSSTHVTRIPFLSRLLLIPFVCSSCLLSSPPWNLFLHVCTNLMTTPHLGRAYM
jgi:hypothetical protein